jgi:hypothetical protein
MNVFVLCSVHKDVFLSDREGVPRFSASTEVCQSLIPLCFPSTASQAGRSARRDDLEVPIGQATIIDNR